MKRHNAPICPHCHQEICWPADYLPPINDVDRVDLTCRKCGNDFSAELVVEYSFRCAPPRSLTDEEWARELGARSYEALRDDSDVLGPGAYDGEL